MRIKKSSGFTLIEMMVAVALFAIVMTVSISSLLALIDANKKAQSLQSAMNNLNVALDGMVRQIRMGTQYRCDTFFDSPNLFSEANIARQNCVVTPKNMIMFKPYCMTGTCPADERWVYYFQKDSHDIGRIYRRKSQTPDRPEETVALTSPEVDIKSFNVYVKGAEGRLYSDLNEGIASDKIQPIVVMQIEGVAGSEKTSIFSVFGTKKNVQTKFRIQATASQRLLDL